MPKPVVNLTATLENGNTIQVDWSAPEESIQDHYVIRHRAILRDSDALWVENSRLNTNFTLSNLFPGERYEIEVYAVKNGIRSEAQNISQVTGKCPQKNKAALSGGLFVPGGEKGGGENYNVLEKVYILNRDCPVIFSL